MFNTSTKLTIAFITISSIYVQVQGYGLNAIQKGVWEIFYYYYFI